MQIHCNTQKAILVEGSGRKKRSLPV